MAHIPRIYHPGRLGTGPVLLDGEQAKRLGAVMRLRAGDEFRLFAGDGREWAAVVADTAKGRVHAEVREVVRQEPAPAVALEVWCALVRPARFDWMVEKCTEAGADVLRPIVTEHVARGEGGSAARKERWQRLAVEAAEQCGRLFVPAVQDPAPFATLLRGPRRPLFVADREGMAWGEAAALLPQTGPVAVAVGPEGGFSPGELAAATAAGAVLVRLGPNILRTETAAVAAAVLVRSVR